MNTSIHYQIELKQFIVANDKYTSGELHVY